MTTSNWDRDAAQSPTINTHNFVRDGFVVLKGFLKAGEIAQAQAEADNLVAAGGESACVRPHNTLLSLRWNDALVALFLADERRAQAIQTAVGATDLKWISGYLSIKEAQSAALWWHQDWWCWQHRASFQRRASQIAVMCYLSPTTTQTGALRVLPGSHHKSSPLDDFLPESHAEAASQIMPDHPAINDYPGQITLNLEAGDAVAIDYRLLHGTHPNASLKRRDCVLLTFAPSWCDLADDLKGHLISHFALPRADENSDGASYRQLLPSFGGARNDLTGNRLPPGEFTVKSANEFAAREMCRPAPTPKHSTYVGAGDGFCGCEFIRR